MHVEDEPNDRRILSNAAEEFSESNDDTITIYPAESVEQAREIIANTNIDAAIVDLKLGGDADDPQGLKLVANFKETIPVVTIIFSGTTGYAEHLITEDNLFLRAYTKGETTADQIISDLYGLYRTGITQLFSHNELLNEYKTLLKKIFDIHISNSIEYWIGNNDKDGLHRYIHHHIAEYYKLDSAGGLAVYSPAELYMTPTINPCPHTGDIILYENCQYLVVTPACDIAMRGQTRNSDYIMLLRLGRIEDYVQISDGSISKNQSDKLKQKLRKYRYYDLPLPKLGNIYSSVIDFQDVVNVPNGEFVESYKNRLATIPESFMKDIIHQFSSYYSRQGAPNIDIDGLYENLI